MAVYGPSAEMADDMMASKDLAANMTGSRDGQSMAQRQEAGDPAATSSGRNDEASAGGTPGGAEQAPVERKIIRTGNMQLEVDSFEEAAAAVKLAAASLGGYVNNENSYVVSYSDGRERRSGNISVRVPYDRYDTMLEQAGLLGKVTNRNVWSEDVTTQYIDLAARIQVYETKLSRLMALLSQSGELETILSIERELAATNADLESMKGQMRYLLSRTDYSTLDIGLTEKLEEVRQIRTTGFAGFLQNLRESFIFGVNGAIRNVQGFIFWLARNLIGIAFLVCIVWFGWTFIIRRLIKRRKAGHSK